jgi:hypothetical protein
MVVARERSMSRAAVALAMSLPAVSKLVAHIGVCFWPEAADFERRSKSSAFLGTPVVMHNLAATAAHDP